MPKNEKRNFSSLSPEEQKEIRKRQLQRKSDEEQRKQLEAARRAKFIEVSISNAKRESLNRARINPGLKTASFNHMCVNLKFQTRVQVGRLTFTEKGNPGENYFRIEADAAISCNKCGGTGKIYGTGGGVWEPKRN